MTKREGSSRRREGEERERERGCNNGEGGMGRGEGQEAKVEKIDMFPELVFLRYSRECFRLGLVWFG